MRNSDITHVDLSSKLLIYTLMVCCFLLSLFIFLAEAVASNPSKCNWEMSVLGVTNEVDINAEPIKAYKILTLGILYHYQKTQFNNFYAFSTNKNYDIADINVIEKLNTLNGQPLQAAKLDSINKPGIYKIRTDSTKKESVIYLITAMDKIISLEKLGAKISPLLTNTKIKRRGGSDFTGPLVQSKVMLKSSTVYQTSIPDGVQVCSYIVE